MLNIGCCAHLTMSDGQFDSMSDRTRRNLFEKVYFVDTPKYHYCLGALGNLWTLSRWDRNGDHKDHIIIDKWV